MQFIADIHIHSRFSRACSRDLDVEHLHASAMVKGVQVVGTGDFTHPGWVAELRNKIEPAEPGLFRLQEALATPIDETVPSSCRAAVRFMLSVEISSIYSRGGRIRKVHNIVCMPDMEGASRFTARLAKLGNVASDGRPIVGVDSRDLLEMMLACDDQSFMIPAHIWTPWFSVLGSRSGFDSLEECFGDLTDHIFAVETGLSSDPGMNWRLSKLDRLALVSNSDAHSPARLGREANCFDANLSFQGIREALKSKNPQQFLGTIEFFPEEGKYHLDGHRKCGIRFDPRETQEHGGFCPRCGKPVTVGVLHRVEELADRPDGDRPQGAIPYTRLFSLDEVIAQALAAGSGSRRVAAERQKLVEQFGPELKILKEVSLDSLAGATSPLIVEGVRRMRAGEIRIAPGYDGEFGSIELFEEGERESILGQRSLISYPKGRGNNNPATKSGNFSSKETISATKNVMAAPSGSMSLFAGAQQVDPASVLDSLNSRQREAVEYDHGPVLVVAGPGTGKTRTLVHRIAYRIARRGVLPEKVLALTFTNKAADEMKQRLEALLGDGKSAHGVTVGTFHSFCSRILHERDSCAGGDETFRLCDERERQNMIRRALDSRGQNSGPAEIRAWGDRISRAKQLMKGPDDETVLAEQGLPEVYKAYQQELAARSALDFDDLLFVAVRQLQEDSQWRDACVQRWRCIMVDEYQDINLAQYLLIRLLAPGSPDLCAIGDPDQAIYGFRGADRKFFLRFQEDYPDAHVVRLDRNYRSTETILKASGQVIAKSKETKHYPAHPFVEGGDRLTITHFPTEGAEAAFVARQVESMMGGISLFSIDSGRAGVERERDAYGFEDFAVFYRLNAQAAALEEALERAGIPFQRVGHDPILERPEVRAIVDCLRALMEPSMDETHLLPEAGQRERKGFPQTNLQDKVGVLPVSYFIEHLAASLGLTTPSLKLLSRIAEPFGASLHDFMNHLAILSEPDIFDSRAEKVALMTLHASKGLEFPVVFITGCEDGLIPFSPQSKTPASDMEEERRLFYVGITRAREHLFLTHAQNRFLYGERRQGIPSPFLSDINEELLQRLSPSQWAKPPCKRKDRQMSLFGPP